MIQISEKDFSANEQARLDKIASTIRDCGISVYELAKGARVKYDTILRALRGRPIRPQTEARVMYYIKTKNNGRRTEQGSGEEC